ncbi:MAG TPA: class IV adenylate cyclase [Thermoanaerobaculia bacterium]
MSPLPGDSPQRHRAEEIEIKLPAPDLSALREKLRARGAELVAPLHFESNDLYDDPDGTLAKAGCILRLRKTSGGAILTFKGPARFEAGTKIREESETEVSDPAELERILEGLGKRPRFRYEKRREEWSLGDCAIALDETPIGCFIEVEGDPSAIRRVVHDLGFDASESLPYSYAELYTRRRREDRSLPPDMVFPSAPDLPGKDR